MPKTLLVGVGGAGAAIVEHLQLHLGYNSLCINTDYNALNSAKCDRRLLIGRFSCRGEPASIPEQGHRAAQESFRELKFAFEGFRALIIVAGLGGGTGSGATPVLIDVAKSLGIEVVPIVVLPFSFEVRRRHIAFQALDKLAMNEVPIIVRDLAKYSNVKESNDSSLLDIFADLARSITAVVNERLQLKSVEV